MNETIVNFAPLFHFIQNVLMTLGFIALVIIVSILIFAHKHSQVFMHSIDKLVEQYPLVNPLFMQYNTKLQTIENNQEIHEINRKLEKMEKRLNGSK